MTILSNWVTGFTVKTTNLVRLKIKKKKAKTKKKKQKERFSMETDTDKFIHQIPNPELFLLLLLLSKQVTDKR